MRARRITPLAAITALAILASAVLVHAQQPQASPSPDRILKGTTPTITITLDKSIPDQSEIKGVRVGGQLVTVQAPSADGKLSVPLPKLDIVGQADIEIIGKDDKVVAATRLTYVEAGEPSPTRDIVLLCVYIGLIVLLPLICTIYDIRKSYAERADVFKKLQPHATTDQVRALLKDMDQGPTGLVGLTRGLLALTLVLALAFAAFHLVVFTPAKVPDIADKLIMLLAGTLTAITGFYFGSKAAQEGAQQQTPASGANAATAPTVTGINPTSGPAAGGTPVTITGTGFTGPTAVKFGANAGTNVQVTNDTEVKATSPAGAAGQQVDVTVVTAAGTSATSAASKFNYT